MTVVSLPIAMLLSRVPRRIRPLRKMPWRAAFVRPLAVQFFAVAGLTGALFGLSGQPALSGQQALSEQLALKAAADHLRRQSSDRSEPHLPPAFTMPLRMTPFNFNIDTVGVAALLLTLLVGGVISYGISQILAQRSPVSPQAAIDLRRANAEMQALFCAMDDLVLVRNQQGVCLKILTPKSTSLLYRSVQDMEGKGLEVFPAAIAQQFAQIIRQVLENQHTVHLEYALAIEGTNKWLDASISPIDQHSVIWVIRDATDRKQTERDRQQAKEAAEAASRTKSIFLANMSHELRTPLNAIIGFTQLLGQDVNLTPAQQNSLAIIHQSGEQLLGLINGVLDMSKIEAGKVTVNPTHFDLRALLQEIVSLFELSALKKHLTLAIALNPHLPPFVHTDAAKLRQVLINLLSNAIKFTQTGGVTLRVEPCLVEPRDRVEPDLAEATHLSFRVEDTGAGMAPADISQAFEPFIQTATGQTSNQGTGLGLSISREFVQLMGGELTLQSRSGQGTVALFTIPMQVATAGHPPPGVPPETISGLASVLPGDRVLIVDDSAVNRLLLRKILEGLGLELREAADGVQAIAEWKAWQPHLILIDMRMPVMDGCEAVRRIRQEAPPHLPPLKIIAVSASAFEAEQMAMLAAGCDGFIHKPFTRNQVLEQLTEHLGQQDRDHPGA
jgi:signal transduction histidine kinase/ActR/RegA family two-component response regulator